MAHEKVVRRSMGKAEWIALRAGWLNHRLYQDVEEITNWEIREARQISENDYEYFDPEYRALAKGETIFAPDGTVFLRARTQLPPRMQGKEVWLQMLTAAELIVKINGQWADGLDPNRNRFPIAPFLDASGQLLIEIEGYNRSKPDDERNPETSALRGCRQVFDGARLVIVEPEVAAAIYDLQVLIETMQMPRLGEELALVLQTALDQALNRVDFEATDPAVYLAGIADLRQYLREQVFANPALHNAHKSGRVALVGHSHLDVAYYWRRIHAVQKNARTCLIQLRLMDRYPEFTYCHTQAYIYETLETYYPEIFAEVKARIREGRFEIAGGMYVEPDCNLPTAESLVRQCLYGQHYFRSRFGITVETCWLPDVFGNSWILPQILRKAGMKYFVSNKMSTWNDTNRFPHNHFIWRGIDGSEVYACVPPTHFITWNTPEQITENWEQFQDKGASAETLNMFGYGDGGSGATEQMLEYQRRMNETPGVPVTRQVRGDQFLRDNFDGNSQLAVWDGELYLEMHRGTFTSKGGLKKRNRDMELLLRDAELLCGLAALEGVDGAQSVLRAAWKKLLLNQFHDILPGSHIAPVTRDALADYQAVAADVQRAMDEAARTLGLLTAEPGTPVHACHLLNTLSWPRESPLFVAGAFAADRQSVVGVSQPGFCRGVPGVWLDECVIPPLAVMPVCFQPGAPTAEERPWFEWRNSTLETPYYHVQLAADGSIISLVDKQNNREVVAPGKAINHIRIYKDYPGVYDAWDILPDYQTQEDEYRVARPIALQSWGNIHLELEVELELNHSRWKSILRFFQNHPRIEVEHEVDWQETNRLAKAEFNFNLLVRQVQCDTSAGPISRETHRNTSWQQARFEVCQHKWTDCAETGYGVALLNDCKYGLSVQENQIALSLLRAPIRPDPNSDKGWHCFSYALLPHAGDFAAARINKAAWEFNTPIRAFGATQAELSRQWLKLAPGNLHLQALKQPELESGSGSTIVRLAELEGRRGKGVLQLPQRVANVVKVNLLEDPEADNDFAFNDTTLSFEYHPYEIVTFRIDWQTEAYQSEKK